MSYSPGDANELMQRIEQLLDDPERAAEIGAEAKRYACAKFTRNDSDFRILKDLKERRGRTDWRVAMPRDVVASLTSIAVQTEQDISDAQHQLWNYQDLVPPCTPNCGGCVRSMGRPTPNWRR